MAFSKAKILRFNDVTTCAPPPGAYNPKFEDHVPGVKYIKDKQSDPQSPVSSTSDVRSVHSGVSIASFRTPTVPRRKYIAMPNSMGKKKTVFSPQRSEALREKIVECINKDETIRDLENQLEELKLAISNLSIQKNDLTIERDEFSQSVKTIQNELENVNKQLVERDMDNRKMIDAYDKMEAELKAQNTVEMKQLQANLDILQERLNKHNAEMEKNEKELEDTKSSYNKLEEEYCALKIKYEETLQFQIELKNIHIAEKESLKRLRETEISELEVEISQVITNWKKTVEKIEKDNENKINDLETKQNIELKKIKDDFMFEEVKLLKNIRDLKLEVEKLNAELKETQTNLIVEINNHQIDKAAALAENHCYEITLNKTNDTVNALKNRLLHSDRDVEQLTKELGSLEKSKFETERKYMQENEMLKKENVELKSENENFMTIQENVVRLEIELLYKIDNFKSKADSEISKLTTIIDKQSNELKKLHSFIQEQQQVHSNARSLVANARNEIEQLELEASGYKLKISKLEILVNKREETIEETDESKDRQIKELKDKLKERDLEMNELASIYKKYIEKSRDYDQLQQKHEELGNKYGQLENKIGEQDTLIGPFREQLENYERECQVLLLHKDEAEKEAKEMGLKYAQILGHQNYKQKVKHIVDLKKKNIDLMECKQNYEAKMMQQNRTIEKLKQKIAQINKSKVIDKENLGSPVRMQIMHSPLVLKERN